ncbi:MmpS family transport accessory protein [Amycolatopsis sp. FU40]|uniref:MmpS family transport accessory protein n=1 Tax=Amycolatopsis sp. FU40 TaxID=2914159 RepID=UPI001F309285|nr:MmpS family transport accessory protein [Amycolatopsis sp. FU40]UKD52624.1 MmpS family transport accessory protein [Amycolatopsis sp. FU40]
MSAPDYPQPPAPYPTPPAQPKNGLGTAGFVLGLLGLIFSFIPVIGLVAWPLVILGIIFSALGFVRSRSGKATNKGLSIAGLVLSVIGLVLCIIWLATAAKVVNEVNNEANRTVTVHYEVSGTAKDASITYTTFGDGSASTNQEQPKALPWSKDISTKGLLKGGSLSVTTGTEGGEVTCKVTVDGKETKTAKASGNFATASCDGF